MSADFLELIQDESLVPAYVLPDVLTCVDGERVADAETWRNKRRPELLELFQREMYGRTPSLTLPISWDVFEESADALGGVAVRRQVRIHFGKSEGDQGMDLLIYLPNGASGPVPVFLGLNFSGNHAVHQDPAIRLPRSWMRDSSGEGNRASEADRGRKSSRWPVELILSRGYGLATIYYGDIDPDFHDGFQNGVHCLFYKEGQTKPKADEWGSIGAWAWGLSRALDYLETLEAVDPRRVIVMGHSRLGKTALWAGAQDERFAMAISNNSGCGGAALSRRCFGETIERINAAFPHWFCDNFKAYNRREHELPFDQHMLIALLAPRPVYVASASLDLWADPCGEFLAAKEASPVYELFGLEGLPADDMPEENRSVQGMIGYHIRTGRHDVTELDWRHYLDFADSRLGWSPNE